MNENDIIRIEDRHLAATYSKLPLTVDRGQGALLWDADGNEYIDCMGGYGVAIVGHCNQMVVRAIEKQAKKLITCHGSIYNEARAELLDRLIRISPPSISRAFLCSSGAESVEAALKIARRYTRRPGIIAMTGSYHGKTLGALSATWTKRYREPFQPLLPGVSFTPFGDADRVREAISEQTAAVIVEPIQGETGVKPAPDGFLHELREICDARGALLMFDEVQTGFGRTGRMWASDHWGVEPDVMCVSKSMAGGLPMGAALAKEEIMGALVKGDHSSTFGGNPISCAAASSVIDYILEERLVERAEKLGNIFKQGLTALSEEYRTAREVRGMGMMLALDMRFDVHNLLLNGLKKRVVLLYSGRNILRFLPPLVITEEQIKRVLDVLDQLISVEEKTRFEQ